MEPTLKIGQRLTVSLTRHYVPRIGDIIVFHPPSGADAPLATCGNSAQGAGHPAACSTPTHHPSAQVFIKRIVALPGDTIKIIDGHVVRNGKQEDDAKYTLPCGGGQFCNYPSQITIPAGDYYVLGDNRGESDDSRFWGPVPKRWIIGKVVLP